MPCFASPPGWFFLKMNCWVAPEVALVWIRAPPIGPFFIESAKWLLLSQQSGMNLLPMLAEYRNSYIITPSGLDHYRIHWPAAYTCGLAFGRTPFSSKSSEKWPLVIN